MISKTLMILVSRRVCVHNTQFKKLKLEINKTNIKRYALLNASNLFLHATEDDDRNDDFII